jgi:hypothetical protein
VPVLSQSMRTDLDLQVNYSVLTVKPWPHAWVLISVATHGPREQVSKWVSVVDLISGSRRNLPNFSLPQDDNA